MSNFTRVIKRNAMQDRLEAEIERLQGFEIRALILLACYEEFAKDLPDSVVQAVGTEMLKNPPANRAAFLQAAKSHAAMEIAKYEYERAASSVASGIPGSSANSGAIDGPPVLDTPTETE